MLGIKPRQIPVLGMLAAINFATTACAAPAFAPHATAAEPESCVIDAVSGAPVARHEAGFIALEGKFYLLGGRGSKPVSIFDPADNKWSEGATPPVEMHHFQPVLVDGEIWIVGAMTGPWPDETPLGHIWRYLPNEDRFERGVALPQGRLRGGGGVAVYGGRIWWAGGITNGHRSGSVAWLDSYDLGSEQWRQHTDAPHARDHWQLAATGNRLYAAGGRQTAQDKNNNFEPTTKQGDVFDIAADRWINADPGFSIPTTRAGLFAFTEGGLIYYGGGESGSQQRAHDEVEIYDTRSGKWLAPKRLGRGRHGTGFAVLGQNLYTASGAGDRGGEPELSDIDCVALNSVREEAGQVRRPHTLDFRGPEVSESDPANPFTDYRLTLMLAPPDGREPVLIRGYYAADGDAADSGASSGRIWRAKFTPDTPGEWRWTARLARGHDIAIDRDFSSGAPVTLASDNGIVAVIPAPILGNGEPGAHAGRLIARDGILTTLGNGERWFKSGTNSPENLLAFNGIDNTYRMGGNARDGEADSGDELHRFDTHLPDWRDGDPQWQAGKGRTLIGAINYLADRGVNSAYFLTWNVEGDGKDVWPFLDPEDPTRFDVSKLDQWERIFAHMQTRGIVPHIVIQETENELLMDGGDTGRVRRLYLAELVARFGHLDGLIWNLGEENGPVHWRPEGQDDEQRKAMVDWLTAIDPYDHPILLHTHSEPADKDVILTPLLGYPGLDGLSFQVSNPELVFSETVKWKRLASEAGQPWVITMDEIGPWQNGAVPDEVSEDDHADLRRHALWGHLIAGGDGVEWYFGAHHPHNDLTAEDFRSRDSLWRQATLARSFFADWGPNTAYLACPDVIASSALYCRMESDGRMLAYIVADTSAPILPDRVEASAIVARSGEPASASGTHREDRVITYTGN